jgi:hypothetical protein
MIRTLSWIVLSILFTCNLTAQKWTYGLKTGATLSQVAALPYKVTYALQGRLTYEHAPVLQFHAGFWAQYKLDQRQTLQGELLWTQQAYQSDDWFATEKEFGYLQFNYLSLPVLLRYHITPRLSVALGPQLSLLLTDQLRRSKLDAPWMELSEDETAWELGANLEIGYRLERWHIGLRAQRDLTPFHVIPVFNLDGTWEAQGKYYHQALHLWVGYALGG